MLTYPPAIQVLNNRLSADLGANPRYAWRWSEDLFHVMEVVDEAGKPQYVEDHSSVVIGMVPATVRRKLLPFHSEQWIACALVPVNERDGSLEDTGIASWIPISSKSGPVCLPHGEVPTLGTTIYLIDAVRSTRRKRLVEMDCEWNEKAAHLEKQHWATVYDKIRSEATAFHNVPGKRGHVSFPTPGTQELIQ